MNLSAKFLIRFLENNGFELKRSKGSHHLFYNSQTQKTVVVPIHNKDLKKGTFFSIIKQAGLDKNDLM